MPGANVILLLWRHGTTYTSIDPSSPSSPTNTIATCSAAAAAATLCSLHKAQREVARLIPTGMTGWDDGGKGLTWALRDGRLAGLDRPRPCGGKEE